jgi:hypothetical protein
LAHSGLFMEVSGSRGPTPHLHSNLGPCLLLASVPLLARRDSLCTCMGVVSSSPLIFWGVRAIPHSLPSQVPLRNPGPCPGTLSSQLGSSWHGVGGGQKHCSAPAGPAKPHRVSCSGYGARPFHPDRWTGTGQPPCFPVSPVDIHFGYFPPAGTLQVTDLLLHSGITTLAPHTAPDPIWAW